MSRCIINYAEPLVTVSIVLRFILVLLQFSLGPIQRLAGVVSPCTFTSEKSVLFGIFYSMTFFYVINTYTDKILRNYLKRKKIYIHLAET